MKKIYTKFYTFCQHNSAILCQNMLYSVNIDGYEVRIYDKERMLIELLRNKNTMPYDLYKEILLKYRVIIYTLQLWRIQEYAEIFPKSKMIKKAI